jgi:hypothetical protein
MSWWSLRGRGQGVCFPAVVDYMLCDATPLPHHSKEEPVIPECEDMIAFTQALEDVGHKGGWDCAPALGTASDAVDGYLSQPFSVQPIDIAVNGDVVTALTRVANAMLKSTNRAREAMGRLRAQDAADSIAGMWFVSEAWESRLPQWLRLEGRIADLPADQRIEVRMAVLVDCGGRVYVVKRYRGEEPSTEVIEPGDPDVRVDGRVVTALRRMLVAVGTSMSDGMIDMEKVAG